MSAVAIKELPATLETGELGLLLKVGKDSDSAREAINARAHRGHPLPPGIMLQGSKKKIWLTATVLEWLRQQQESTLRNSGIDAVHGSR